MNCHECAESLPEYLQRSLGDMQSASVEEHLRQCAECRDDVEMWHRLLSIPEDRPTESMRLRFEEMLTAYQEGLQSQHAKPTSFGALRRARWMLPVAATALVTVAFAAGVFFEHAGFLHAELNSIGQELGTMRQIVAVSLLQNRSASDRLEGINWSARLSQPNPQIEERLLDVLRFDDSIDLRLAAADALRRFSAEPSVRGAIRDSLKHQESPMVQIALMDFFVQCHDYDAIESLKTLARKADLLPEVKQKIHWALNELNRG